MWDLSSLTRDEPTSPALEGEVLTTGVPGKFLSVPLKIKFSDPYSRTFSAEGGSRKIPRKK